MPPPANLAELLDTRVYPGMIETESRILRAFIRAHGAGYDELRFNERLGEGVILQNPASEKDRRDWERRTKARPDVIAWLAPNVATIVEVKEQATLETIWQVLSYVELYAKSFPGHQARAAIVAGAITLNARELAPSRGVDVFLYTIPASAPLAPGQEQTL